MTTTAIKPETFASYQALKANVEDVVIPGVALSPLPWMTTRNDVHSISCEIYSGNGFAQTVRFDCACGHAVIVEHTNALESARESAFALLLAHAQTTCALCHGPKSVDTFPRCSACAF